MLKPLAIATLLISAATQCFAQAALPPALENVRALLRDGKTKEATQAAAKAVIATPNDPVAWQWHSNANCRMAQEANMLMKMSWAGDCKDGLLKFRTLAPSNVDANAGLLQFYLAAPGIAGGGRDKADALVLEMTQQSAGLGHFGRGLLALTDKKESDAEAAFKAAIEADPKAVPYRMQLATLYGRNTRWADARGVFTELLAIDPKNAMAMYQLGRAAALSGEELESGLGYLEQFIVATDRPSGLTEAAAHWRKGQILEKQGRKAEAIAAFERATTLDPKFDEAKKDLSRLKAAS